MNNPKTVSVVITSRNEEENIKNCLESIKKQDYSKDCIEVIVVDNNSEDNTLDIARSYTDKICTYGPERSAQRNYGVKKAKGEYVLYLDADMVLSENVISECVEKCRNETCVALYIPERIIGRGFWIKVRDFERSFYDATVVDCVRFIRRDKFLQLDGFDENLIGPEDWDFDRRIKEKGRVGIIVSALYHNEGEFSLRKYLAKKRYYAGGIERYRHKWGSGDAVVKKQLGLWYRYFGVFLEEGKWLKVISHPVLSLAMCALRVLVGINYLRYGKYS